MHLISWNNILNIAVSSNQFMIKITNAMVRQLSFFTVLLLIFSTGKAQDCTLDIGGKNSETIIKVFQLNETQKSTMEALRGELKIETKSIEDQIEKLLAEHPQSKEEDLITMGNKYKTLQQKLVQASWQSDKKLLATFNTKQYERYLELCHAAIRRPIAITPKIYKDSVKTE